jgi:hypothetical protein
MKGVVQMVSSERLSIPRLLGLTQLDKIILTLAGTCALPIFLHALPGGWGETVGPRWLPIFYAPLIASLCFRPHVTLLVCLIAPMINHVIFQMPSTQLLPLLMCELLIFNAIMVIIRRWYQAAGWQVIPAYAAALFLGLSTVGQVPFEQVGSAVLLSVRTAAGGIIVLVITAEVIGRLQKKTQA